MAFNPFAVCSTLVAFDRASEAVFVVCDTVDDNPVTVCFSSVTLFTVVSFFVIAPSSFVPNSFSFVCWPFTVPVMSAIWPAILSPLPDASDTLLSNAATLLSSSALFESAFDAAASADVLARSAFASTSATFALTLSTSACKSERT